MAGEARKLPQILPPSVRRTTAEGLPTKPLLDWEEYTRAWYKGVAEDLQGQTKTLAIDLGTASGRIDEIVNFTVTPSSVLAQKITNIEGNVGTNTGAIQNVLSLTIDPTSALAQQFTSLTTSVAGNTATLLTYGESIDGIGVKYVVEGSINGVTGGFVFSGVKRADGIGATFLLEITANVSILGDLLVSGTITNPKMAANSITNTVSASAFSINPVGAPFTTIKTTGDTRVLVIASVSDTQDTVYQRAYGANPVSREFVISRQTGAVSVVVGAVKALESIVGAIYEGVGGGGISVYRFHAAVTPATRGIELTIPAGSHSFFLSNPTGVPVQLSVVVMELAA